VYSFVNQVDNTTEVFFTTVVIVILKPEAGQFWLCDYPA